MTTRQYRIEGMDCTDCAAKITKGVRLLHGVSQVELNFPNDVLKVEGDLPTEQVIKRVQMLGYGISPVESAPVITLIHRVTTQNYRIATQRYRIEGMDCADCAAKITKGVRLLQGVSQVELNFPNDELKVEGDPASETVIKRVQMLGYGIQAIEDAPASLTVPAAPAPAKKRGFVTFLLGRKDTRLALVGGGLLLLSLLSSLLRLPALITTGLQIVALLVAGYPIARSGLATLFINRDINVNLLMTIAGIGALAIGDTAEAATLIFLFAVAEALEGFTTDRARRVVGELGELAPAVAVRISLASGREETVPVGALALDDLLLVRPGERIPMDGEVVGGSSDVDQAPITGESQPVLKETGAPVFAGTVNGSGSLRVRVTRLVEDNTLSRIVRLVSEAQSTRAPSQRMVDRFARWYTPAMVLLAVLVAAVPPLVFRQPFFDPAAGVHGGLYRALALLVIACPCALVLSTPVTILSAITAAARRGVLIKGGAFLEALAQVKVFAFDKTGTLTHGRPVVTRARSVDCPTGVACPQCDDVLALASSLERHSTHPLGKAVVAAAVQRGLLDQYAPAETVTALNGQGLQGYVNGRLATVGSHRLFDDAHPHRDEVCDWVRSAEEDGSTTMMVCDGDRVRGFIAASDEVRADSQQAVAELQALGYHTVMLTGDNPTAASRVAEQLGIEAVRSELLPEDKVGVVRELAREYGPVAMVGDGINDTPALAAAHVGIAVGGAASAQALETADVVLMAGDLQQLPAAARLASFTRQVVAQNISLSLLVKLGFVLLALSGITSLWLAVIADVGVSLLVTTNGLRPLRYH